MTTSPRSRSSTTTLLPAAALGLLTLGACNAIFGIEAGLPGGTGGMGTAGTSSSTGTGPACGTGAGPADGAVIKLRISSAPEYDQGNAVTYDGQDNLIAAGLFEGGTLTLGSSLAHVGTAKFQNAFVIKFDPSGAYLWGQAFGGTKAVRVNAAGTDAAGNIYLTGALAGTATIGKTTLTAPSDPSEPTLDYPDAFVLALDPEGNVKWVKKFGNLFIQRGHRIAVDAAGNTYVAGTSFDKVDFDDGNGLLGDASSWWSFFLKLDPNGKTVWVQPFGAWDSDLTPDYQEFFELAIALDGKGRAIIGGNFKAQIFFGDEIEAPVGETDAFVAALDAMSGKMIWHRTFHQATGNAGTDGNQWITALTTDPCSGDIYAAGGFTRGIDLGAAGSATITKGDPIAADMFVARLAASDGAPQWFHAYGDAGRQDAAAVKVSPDGTVLLAGFMRDGPGYTGVDFGGAIKTLGTKVPDPAPDYNSDAFLIKLDAAGNGLWGTRFGDYDAQAAFDVAVNSQGKIALTGIGGGTLTLGNGQPPLTADYYDVFLARFDP